jgi:hypothetical protein
MLRRCGKCGLPRLLARDITWPGNGTIISKRDASSRLIIYEADYQPFLWSELDGKLGFSTAETFNRSRRMALQDYVENHILYGWKKYAIKALPVSFLINRIIRQAALFGLAQLEVLEHERGKVLAIRIRRPFDISSMAGGIRSVFEILEDTGSRLAWTEEEGGYIVTVAPAPEEDEAGKEEALRTLEETKAEFTYDLLSAQGEASKRCPSCDLPSGLTGLDWGEQEGIIYLRERGTRVIVARGYGFLCSVRELEKKTEQDLGPFILEISRIFHRRMLKGTPIPSRGETYRAAERFLSVAGFGEVVRSSFGEGHLEMTIHNPFYIPRLVGRIAGLFEYVEGEEADVDYRSPGPQVLELKIKTA